MLCGVVVASCESGVEETALGKDVIEIQTSVGVVPRSPSLDATGKGDFNPGDVFSILTTGEELSPLSTDYEVGKTQMTWSKMNLPSTVRTVNFSACYPRQSVSADGTFVFDVNTAQEKDLLLATAQPRASTY